ncbi:GntR family transcriptional regulator [Oricola indica]|uniref:GntR family transcriptional regulator n=1 Tax=Oricola indica TaxID=2872591 RepID=UPI003CCBCCA2
MSKTMSNEIAADVREKILTGVLKPGERIKQEILAERYGTSRIPVREALRILENSGLVIFIPNNGAWVADLDMTECIEVYKIRERLEPLALSESIKNMNEETENRLMELVEHIEAAPDIESFLQIDREFHLLSYSRSRMPDLMKIIEKFWNTTQHYRRSYSRILGDNGQWIIHAEHRMIMNAIVQRDLKEAENLIEAHIRKTRLVLENEYGKTK